MAGAKANKNKDKNETKKELVIFFKVSDPKVGWYEPKSKKYFTGDKTFKVTEKDPEFSFVLKNLSKVKGQKPFYEVKK